VVNSPVKLSRTPVALEKASPDLGEHTAEVLENLLGFRREDISRLRIEKAI
jgi:crotonobetainyl-CoA:carnitine CoA-transferase CaiB-like acyl-CoA transferase